MKMMMMRAALSLWRDNSSSLCRMEFKGFLGRFPKDPLEHIFSLVVIPLVVCYVRWWLHIGMDMAMCAPTG